MLTVGRIRSFLIRALEEWFVGMWTLETLELAGDKVVLRLIGERSNFKITVEKETMS